MTLLNLVQQRQNLKNNAENRTIIENYTFAGTNNRAPRGR